MRPRGPAVHPSSLSRFLGRVGLSTVGRVGALEGLRRGWHPAELPLPLSSADGLGEGSFRGAPGGPQRWAEVPPGWGRSRNISKLYGLSGRGGGEVGSCPWSLCPRNRDWGTCAPGDWGLSPAGGGSYSAAWVTGFHLKRNSSQLHGTYCEPGIFVTSWSGPSCPHRNKIPP